MVKILNMFNNRSQQTYTLPPSCIYQSSYANYPDGEINGVSHLDNAVETCNQQALQATWPNFYSNNRMPAGFDQFVIMSHNSLANQFYSDYNNHAFTTKNSVDIQQDVANQQEHVATDMRNYTNFKCDGRRSTESAIAVSSDGLRSCSVSPEMNVQYSLSNTRSVATKTPQLPRPEFEWMTKTSYQSQPNPGKTRTKDKYRVVYTDKQRLELEKEFHFNRYITIRRKAELAELLGLSERQVKIWFQNRRAKERKQQKKKEEFSRHQAKEQGIVVCHQINTMSMGSPNLLRPLPQFEHQNANARPIALY